MTAIHQYCSLLVTITIQLIITIIVKPTLVAGRFQPSQWTLAHATFYGDETASATMGTLSFPKPFQKLIIMFLYFF